MNPQNALIVKRVDEGVEVRVSEIKTLAESAGYNIVGSVTQSRKEDYEYNIGSGALSKLHRRVKEQDVGAVIFDNDLDVYQMYNVKAYLDDYCHVLDKEGLILERFESRASSKEGKMQIELARLKHQLPMVQSKERLSVEDENPGFMSMGEYDKREESDIKSRISELEKEISKIEDRKESRIKRRKEMGFSNVCLVGYTNAGKSELLRRLSSDNSVNENDDLHPDLEPEVESENKLFTTLDTRTRKMDDDDRDVLVTDTIGLIDDIPGYILESFASTFASIRDSDLDILVVDLSEDKDEIRRKILASHKNLRGKGARLITVYNKLDKVDNPDSKIRYNRDICDNYIKVSARTGENIDLLKKKINNSLPKMKKHSIELPLKDESMRKVSWLYDNTNIETVRYKLDRILVVFRAAPRVMKKVRSNIH